MKLTTAQRLDLIDRRWEALSETAGIALAHSTAMTTFVKACKASSDPVIAAAAVKALVTVQALRDQMAAVKREYGLRNPPAG